MTKERRGLGRLGAMTFALAMVSAIFVGMIGLMPRTGANQGGPDGFGYVWTDSNLPAPTVTYGWVDGVTGGIATGLSDDDNTGFIPLGFTFNFYGIDYAEVAICSNGWISFTNISSTLWGMIPDPATPNTVIAPFWEDLNPSAAGEIYFLSDTISVPSKFIVTWDAVPIFGTTDYQTFEIVLYENGEIWLQYQALVNPGTPTVGIENENGDVGLTYPMSLSNSLAVRFSVPMLDHDIAVRNLQAPSFLQPGESTFLNATIENIGLNDEFNINVNFTINGTTEANTTIPFLGSSTSTDVAFPWTAGGEADYIVGIEVTPIPNENYTGNNQQTQTVHVGFFIGVGIFDHDNTGDISYWTGGNQNLFSEYDTILTSDPESRFSTVVITDLSASTLSGIDALLLPDNAVPDIYLTDVSNFFSAGGGIITVDSAVCYAAYSGFLWPGAAGTNGEGIYWDYGSSSDDQEILITHKITEDYVVGNVYSSISGDAQMFDSLLPTDALALTAKSSDNTKIYVAAREVAGEGRIVELGPYAPFIGSPPSDLHELVRDAVEWSVMQPLDHDIAVRNLQAPSFLQPGESTFLNATIENIGLNDEFNINVNFTINGTTEANTTIPFLGSSTSTDVAFPWTAGGEADYIVGIEVTPIPNENYTGNNQQTQIVEVRWVKGFILFDQTHSTDNISLYSDWVDNLTTGGYLVDTYTAGVIDPSTFAGYDVFVIPQAQVGYSAGELTAIQDFVSGAGGLLVIGDDEETIYSDLSGFAGIDWISGGTGGITTDITSHEITTGVSSVYLDAPVAEMMISGNAIDLVRDPAGGIMLAVSEDPGRVAGFADEGSLWNVGINMEDNLLLANNIIEWLVGFRFEHDIAVSNLNVDSPLERWISYEVSALIRNIGLNDESDITVNLLYDGTLVSSTDLSYLAADSTMFVSFDLIPSSLGNHTVGVEVVPIPNENFTENNLLEVQVFVQDTTAPQTPANLQVRNTADPTALELTWDPNTEPDLEYYTIYKSVDGTNYYFEAKVYPPLSSYTDSGLLQGLYYYYQLTASDDIPNESPPSMPAVGMPGTDHDGDGLIDIIDLDDDDDGLVDERDDFPWDPDEWKDSDGDGIGNNADDDDDGDGIPDDQDEFPLNPHETKDSDGDGIGDNADQDDDDDGVPDLSDQFPFDSNESVDTDGDGIGNNADDDDDGDGIPDASDPNPLFPTQEVVVDLGSLEALTLWIIVLLFLLFITLLGITVLFFLRMRRTSPPPERESSGE
ncbi:MAG: CARDB domain-containing protein [Thermoplasmata archaeon]